MTDHFPTNIFLMVVFPVKFSPSSRFFSWQNSRKPNHARDDLGFGLVFFPAAFVLIYMHIRYIHVENNSQLLLYH